MIKKRFVWMKLKQNKFKLFFVVFLSLIFFTQVFAVDWPYAPGATLDPGCAPGDTDCVVNIIETDPITGAVNGLVKANGAGSIGVVVSGTDIKTINGGSLLGSGDIAIAGGSSYTFGNGLTETAGVVKLGGLLTENETIIGEINYSNYDSGLEIRLRDNSSSNNKMGIFSMVSRIPFEDNFNYGAQVTGDWGSRIWDNTRPVANFYNEINVDAPDGRSRWMYVGGVQGYNNTTHVLEDMIHDIYLKASDWKGTVTTRHKVSETSQLITNDLYTESSDGIVMGLTQFNLTGNNGIAGFNFYLDDWNNGLIITSPSDLTPYNWDSYFLPVSVNGNFADATGNITVATGGIPDVTVVNTSNLFSTGLTGTGSGVTTGASYSNFLGQDAGNGATYAYRSNFFGYRSGYLTEYANNSNFFGYQAGNLASEANGSNFLGPDAGNGATYAYGSNFLGDSAGYNAINADDSNFFGVSAGSGATNADGANFFGPGAGTNATNARFSNFLGYYSGFSATNAANSIFIGKASGQSDTVNNTAAYNDTTTFANTSILIGHKTSTGGFSNSIAIGAYATNTAINQMMIGSTTRPIDTTRFQGATTECTITTGTGIACTSDERLKTNITDLSDNILEKLLQVRTINYSWLNGDQNKTNIGFLAQDLEQYFPELVSTDSEGYKSVYYGNMTPILVEAIREINLKLSTINDMEKENTWRDAFISWFSDTSNNIIEFVAGTIRAKNKICIGEGVEEVCITKEDLLRMKENPNYIIENKYVVVEEPVLEEPVEEEIVSQEPAVEESSPQEPAEEEQVEEDQVSQEPAVQEPAVQEPAVEEQAEEELVPQEPIAEEPTN